MPKNNSSPRRKQTPPRQRRLSVRSELRREPDVSKIARAVAALAIAQAEKEAQEQAENWRSQP